MSYDPESMNRVIRCAQTRPTTFQTQIVELFSGVYMYASHKNLKAILKAVHYMWDGILEDHFLSSEFLSYDVNIQQRSH